MNGGGKTKTNLVEFLFFLSQTATRDIVLARNYPHEVGFVHPSNVQRNVTQVTITNFSTAIFVLVVPARGNHDAASQ
jgi:hypothetical protein